MEFMVLAGVFGFAVKTVAFLFLIGVLVIIHEWGHYIMSKLGGVPVKEFAIGFGPVVTKLFQRGETTFNLRALPVGGFVQTVGMEPGDMTEGGYNTKPLWTRAKIISAGAIINLIFGVLLFIILGVTLGLPSKDKSIVGVGQVNPNSPAARAGFQPGDVIVSVDGKPVADNQALRDAIRSHPGSPISIVLSRKGQTVPVTATPEAKTEDGKKVGQLGFLISEDLVWERHGLLDSITIGAARSWDLAAGILKSITTKATWQKRELGGPIAIAQAAGGYAERGLKYYLWFMAMFSINLGVLNLLPLPVLDGGHLVLLGLEAVQRRRLSTRFIVAFQSIGVALLFLFFMFIMASDLLRAMGRG